MIFKMKMKVRLCLLLQLFVFTFVICGTASAQTGLEILTGDALKKIVPGSFYFAGQSGETQIRNSAAARIGENRFIIAGLVDTSGYSTEISGIYEGFLITDSPIRFGSKTLKTGAYGIGFAKDAVNIFDLSSKQILSVKASNDAELKRPRPLMMTIDGNSVRLYKGRTYILISGK
jgi:hypothetical protein